MSFGPCEHCENPAVLKYNGTPYCMEHYEEAVKKLAEWLRDLMERKK